MTAATEYVALITAAILFAIVLVVSFMCIQLFNLRKPIPPKQFCVRK
jgi:hypothetical protein